MLKKALVLLFIIAIAFVMLFGCQNDAEKKKQQDVNDGKQSIEYKWEATLNGYRNIETNSPPIEIINNKKGIVDYCKKNNMLLAVDSEGNYKNTEIGQMLKKYDDTFFADNILIILPQETSPSNYLYKIENVYIKENKVFIEREPFLKSIHNDDVANTIYLITISYNQLIDLDVEKLSIGEISNK